MKRYLLPQDGQFYKANLHCHTVISDGHLTPAEVKEAYVAQGYAVVAFTDHRGRPETHKAELRVNSPFACKDWRFSLSSYREQNGQVEVLMQARRAPGRFASLCGMVGIIICTAAWCWWRKEDAV